ncbi:hypothetical protein BYT27DRAFT_7254557 [Phlegmacium glaucopus]|nr:hypothetical protein BYT27DRAFT_7254557 [Phlegmacium glaucopus]
MLPTSFPEALNHDMLIKISSFLLYTSQFKNDILLAQASNGPAGDPPLFLPQSVAIILSNLCDIDLASSDKLWSYLKDAVWHYAETAKVVDERFKCYGKDLGFSSLYPPVNYCINGQCKPAAKGLKLQKTDQTQGVLYTLDKGVHPVWVITFQCVECQRAYYHNYFMEGGMRYYYDGDLPDVIQVEEHQFVERKVVNMWRTDMNVAWKSFTNCARTYEISLSVPNCHPADWPFKAALKGDHV